MAAQSLSCGTWDLQCWDLVPWPGMEPGPPALGARSLSHWLTTEDLWAVFWTRNSDLAPSHFPGKAVLPVPLPPLDPRPPLPHLPWVLGHVTLLLQPFSLPGFTLLIHSPVDYLLPALWNLSSSESKLGLVWHRAGAQRECGSKPGFFQGTTQGLKVCYLPSGPALWLGGGGFREKQKYRGWDWEGMLSAGLGGRITRVLSMTRPRSEWVRVPTPSGALGSPASPWTSDPLPKSALPEQGGCPFSWPVFTPSPSSKSWFIQTWMLYEHACVRPDDLAERLLSPPAPSCPFDRGKG